MEKNIVSAWFDEFEEEFKGVKTVADCDKEIKKLKALK